MLGRIPRWFHFAGLLLLIAVICFCAAIVLAPGSPMWMDISEYAAIRTMWRIGTATGLAGLFCLFAGFISWERHRARQVRLGRNHICLYCDYDLRGSLDNQSCPECGHSHQAKDSPAATEPSSNTGRLLLIAIAVLFLSRRGMILIFAGDSLGSC